MTPRTLRNAYDPPKSAATIAAPAPSPTGLLGDREAVLRSVVVPPPAVLTASLPVYTTTRRWRGIDVYANLSGVTLSGNNIVSIGVFAIVGGVRQLVGTGRTRGASGRLVSVRHALAERFDVQLSVDDAASVQGQVIQIGVMAADEALPNVDDTDGRIPALATGNLSVTANAIGLPTTPVFPYEIVSVNGISSVAGRYLHVRDLDAAAANQLVMAFGLPVLGESVFVDSNGLRSRRFSNPQLAVSTSPTTTVLAAPGDVALGMWVR